LNNRTELTETTEFVDIKRQYLLTLTRRQKQTLYWLLRGHSAKMTAARLSISHRTVEHHVENIKNNNHYKSTREIMLNVRFV
jgi:DNA-binding CsgD family transcriptional regulator